MESGKLIRSVIDDCFNASEEEEEEEEEDPQEALEQASTASAKERIAKKLASQQEPV